MKNDSLYRKYKKHMEAEDAFSIEIIEPKGTTEHIKFPCPDCGEPIECDVPILQEIDRDTVTIDCSHCGHSCNVHIIKNPGGETVFVE